MVFGFTSYVLPFFKTSIVQRMRKIQADIFCTCHSATPIDGAACSWLSVCVTNWRGIPMTYLLPGSVILQKDRTASRVWRNYALRGRWVSRLFVMSLM